MTSGSLEAEARWKSFGGVMKNDLESKNTLNLISFKITTIGLNESMGQEWGTKSWKLWFGFQTLVSGDNEG